MSLPSILQLAVLLQFAIYWAYRLLLAMLDLFTQLVNPCMLNYSQRQIHKQARPRKTVGDLAEKTQFHY